MNRTAIVAIGLSMMLFGCGKVENDLVLEPETIAAVEQMEVLDEELEEVGSDVEVEELAEAGFSEVDVIEEVEAEAEVAEEEVNEEVAEVEGTAMFTIGKADVFDKADETSERLATVDENYEVSVIGSEGEYSEVKWLEGTGYVKTVLLSTEKVEEVASWERQSTLSNEEKAELAKQEEAQEAIEEIESQNDVTVTEEAVPEPAPATPSAEQQAMIDILLQHSGGYLQPGTDVPLHEISGTVDASNVIMH